MTKIQEIKEKVLSNEPLSREEALLLTGEPLEELSAAADEIRKTFCGDGFDLCSIINGKSGRCPEDCRFCAQSAHSGTGSEEYPLLGTEELLEGALKNEAFGVLRFSIVTSGKRLTDREVDRMCAAVREIRKKSGISLCVSFGLLDREQFARLKSAGVTRIHCNLETSRRYFPNICTTHSFEDKLDTLRAAASVGLSLCSGGIVGMGETWDDRIDMAFTLRELGVKSVPVNMLNPIPGTPLEHCEVLSPDEMRRIVAVFRFILPAASIRLAGGRELMPDKGESCFVSGANAAITGDMLTTKGITAGTDIYLAEKNGYRVRLVNE